LVGKSAGRGAQFAAKCAEPGGRGVEKLDLFAEKLKARVEKPVEKSVGLQVLCPVSQSANLDAASVSVPQPVELQAIGSASGAKLGGHGGSEPPSKEGSGVSPGDAAGVEAGEPE